MKIIVPVKRVVDSNVKVRAQADGAGVETTNLKMSMNPFDEIAVEAAVQLKEAGIAAEVITVSIGPREAGETVRTALAMGADRGLLVLAESAVEPLAAAKILKRICEDEKPRLVIAGKQAIDDDAGQTGPMLAALLGWPQATQAYRLHPEAHAIRVERETDDGIETLELRLPAVITCDLRLNEPRYASLPNVMKARKKPLAETTPAALGVDIHPRLTVLKVEEPPQRPAGVKVASIGELLDKLAEAGVL